MSQLQWLHLSPKVSGKRSSFVGVKLTKTQAKLAKEYGNLSGFNFSVVVRACIPWDEMREWVDNYHKAKLAKSEERNGVKGNT